MRDEEHHHLRSYYLSHTTTVTTCSAAATTTTTTASASVKHWASKFFPPPRLGLPWSVRVDQGDDELGPGGRHSPSRVAKPRVGAATKVHCFT